MKFQVNQGWAVGQYLIPASTVIDSAVDNERWSPIVRDLIPPLTATSLDIDAAMLLWHRYPEHRHRLRRKLDEHNEAELQKLLAAGV